MTDTIPTLTYVDTDGDELCVTAVPDTSTRQGADGAVALAITHHCTDEPVCVYVPLAEVDRLLAAIRDAREQLLAKAEA